MLFPRINIGDKQVTFKEVTLGTVISIAKIKHDKLEHQLSQFIAAILDDEAAPYELTVQQRYFCLLQYIGSQSKNDFEVDVDVGNFLFNDNTNDFKLSVKIGDVSVRQLNGAEIEVLENLATDYADWITGAMALQVTSKQLPAFAACQDKNQIQAAIVERHQVIKDLPITDFNTLHEHYLSGEEQLTSLVSIGFDDNGVILYPRGTDDAPCRFQADTIFSRSAKFIYKSLVFYGTEHEQCNEQQLS